MTTAAGSPGGQDDLVWGVLDSFVHYVRGIKGLVTVISPATATADGRFRFPLQTVDGAVAKFGGAVRFVAHGGALTLEIREPWVAATSAPRPDRTLSVRGTRATNSEGGRLAFAHVHPDNSTTLTEEAVVAFDFRYPTGTALAPVNSSAGGSGLIARR